MLARNTIAPKTTPTPTSRSALITALRYMFPLFSPRDGSMRPPKVRSGPQARTRARRTLILVDPRAKVKPPRSEHLTPGWLKRRKHPGVRRASASRSSCLQRVGRGISREIGIPAHRLAGAGETASGIGPRKWPPCAGRWSAWRDPRARRSPRGRARHPPARPAVSRRERTRTQSVVRTRVRPRTKYPFVAIMNGTPYIVTRYRIYPCARA
jgi:hypothetical protein